MGIFILVGIVVIFALVATYLYKQQRIKDMMALARRLGLRFDREDPFDLVDIPFALFRAGDGRACENVISGSVSGLELRLFDYWYYDESTNGKGGRTRSYHRFDCCVTTIQAACSHLVLSPETFLTRLESHVGLHDIEFESEEFNKAFLVKSRDRKFASAFVDPRMMQWLIMAKGWSFEVIDQFIMVYGGRMPASKLSVLTDILKGFVDHVPSVVPSLYPLSR